jgi:hypothetical protein
MIKWEMTYDKILYYKRVYGSNYNIIGFYFDINSWIEYNKNIKKLWESNTILNYWEGMDNES